MSAEQFEKGVKIEAAAERLDQKIQELDETVTEYEEILEQYQNNQASRQEIKESIDDAVDQFHAVFDAQNWLGELTAEMTEKEVENSYGKFAAYRGLVCAADEIQDADETQVSRPRLRTGNGALRDESEGLVESWDLMTQVYEEAVNLENLAQEISLEEGREEEGLNPYAFDTPFSILQDQYQRVADLNRCVNSSYC